jgi:hypothetical protein
VQLLNMLKKINSDKITFYTFKTLNTKFLKKKIHTNLFN